MKKIILIVFIVLLVPLVIADTSNTYHSAKIGSNNTLFNSRISSNTFGNFFETGLQTIQEQILENIQWFNTELFRTNTTGGAISHLVLLASVIGMVTLAEVTINPALMLLAGLGMFFFGWLVLLSVSMMMGFFLFPFSTIYIVRIIKVVQD